MHWDALTGVSVLMHTFGDIPHCRQCHGPVHISAPMFYLSMLLLHHGSLPEPLHHTSLRLVVMFNILMLEQHVL
jgi:hypothetical protein